ncbi:hypothetical protein NLG97_g6120 [Lecanicillium saksenae]|uniref:Uncharacterized protein n=1 Tax=Lecanicillium saksenae TaxID=468837 RepID=A0ACC1QR41_9HYPO|nr:hypothetical protein NLG97_g6120 [Lecanicillium saksenae]
MGDRDVLSSDVTPHHYELDITNLNFEDWTYHGKVQILSNFRAATQSIILHATHLKFQSAEVRIGNEVAAVATAFESDDKKETVTIRLDRQLPVTDEATISILFQGIINSDLSGFYRAEYKPVTAQAASVPRTEDGAHFTLATHFQPAYTRRTFPCFDVPYLKATFAVSIEVPSDMTALSNMPVKSTTASQRAGWEIVSFETSPFMSTYLLAWSVGDFGYVEAFAEKTYNGKPVPVRIYTVRGIEKQGEYALAMAPKVIDLYSDLFGIPYPLEKMDILVVPEMPMDGMEHWGLITSRPSMMLFNKGESSESAKFGIADNVCHELAHQWFGNLVTMDWWNEIWLNEGFATWVGNYTVNLLFPEWNVWGEFANGRMEDAFRVDGLRSSHPVHIPADTGLQLHQYFDQISYGKGCVMIRMLASYLGVEIFFQGVCEYLKANAYGNATASALWACLDTVSGKDVGAMADCWLNHVGYPVLEVTEDAEKSRIHVKQSRFLTTGDVKPEDDTTVWRVPLGIQGSQVTRDDPFLLTKGGIVTDIDMDFYLVNTKGTGFYRVAYPPERLAKLSTQLDQLTTEDKISIIGSVAALSSVGASSTVSLLSFLQGFRMEEHCHVWWEILDVLNNLNTVFAEDTQLRAGLRQFTLRLIDTKASLLMRDGLATDDILQKSLYRSVLTRAAECGHPETIEKFYPMFEDWASNGTDIEPTMRRIVFHSAMSKDPKGTFKIIKDAVLNMDSSDTKRDLLRAVVATDDHDDLAGLAPWNISGAVGIQDIGVILMALAAHPIGRHSQWEFVKNAWDAVADGISDPGLMTHFLRITLEGFSTEAVALDVDAFAADKDMSSFRSTIETAKEQIRGFGAYRNRDSEALREWLLNGKYI